MGFQKQKNLYFLSKRKHDLNKKIFFLILQFIILTSFNFGQSNNPKPFNLDFTREAILLGTGAAAGLTSLIIFNNIEPLTLEEINSLNPADVNGFDRGAIGPYKVDYASDVLLYTSFLLPVTFLTNEEMNKDFFDLAVMYSEVLLVAGSVNELVKVTVKRTRPFVYDPNTEFNDKITKDARVSFFSGHTTATAAISFFTAKVFSEYLKDNTVKIIIWSAAALYPAVTGLLRFDSHSHFPTDVIVGYIAGAAIGYIIPELHKSDNENNVSVQSSGNLHNPVLSIQIKF
jgi:membrane-associated phospholipid phosphatase